MIEDILRTVFKATLPNGLKGKLSLKKDHRKAELIFRAAGKQPVLLSREVGSSPYARGNEINLFARLSFITLKKDNVMLAIEEEHSTKYYALYDNGFVYKGAVDGLEQEPSSSFQWVQSDGLPRLEVNVIDNFYQQRYPQRKQL